MKANDRSVHIRFHGLEKSFIEGKVVTVAHDFVEIRRPYTTYICPFDAIRVVTLKE